MDNNQIDAGCEVDEREGLEQQSNDFLEYRTDMINNFCKMNDHINDYNQSVWMFNFKPSKLDILRLLDMYYAVLEFPLSYTHFNSPHSLQYKCSMIHTKHHILLQNLYKIYMHLFYNTNKSEISLLLHRWRCKKDEPKIGCFYTFDFYQCTYYDKRTYAVLINITDKSYVFQYLEYPDITFGSEGEINPVGEPVLKTTTQRGKKLADYFPYTRQHKSDDFKYKKIRDYFDYHNSKKGQKIYSKIMIEEEKFDKY